MSCRLNSKYKICRRLGANLWGNEKDPSLTKNYFPGQHGPLMQMRRLSDYGTQLMAKQKLKGYYGNIGEKQFHNIYKEAFKIKGDTSENLIGLLERRLDIVIYRANFAPTPFNARQVVNHKHILVNGKTVNIPSYRLKDGDVIELKDRMKKNLIVLEAIEKNLNTIPSYLEVNHSTYIIKVLKTATLSEVPYPVVMEPNLVVEFYSR